MSGPELWPDGLLRHTQENKYTFNAEGQDKRDNGLEKAMVKL